MHFNTYALIQIRYKMQGCSCDKGYFGGDCSQRQCGHGLDPLYSDDTSAIKYSVFNFGFLTTSGTIVAHICIYIYLYTHTNAYMLMFKTTYIHTYIHTYMYSYIHANIHVHILLHAYRYNRFFPG